MACAALPRCSLPHIHTLRHESRSYARMRESAAACAASCSEHRQRVRGKSMEKRFTAVSTLFVILHYLYLTVVRKYE